MGTTHHTGLEDFVIIEINGATGAAVNQTFTLPFQAKFLNADFAADTSMQGTAASIIIGTDADPNQIVEAQTLSSLNAVSLSIDGANPIIPANTRITANLGQATAAVSVGGHLTLFFEWDKDAELA